MALQKDANLQQSKGKFQQVLFSQNPDGENDNKSSSYDQIIVLPLPASILQWRHPIPSLEFSDEI